MDTNILKERKERIVWLDAIKVIAIFMMIAVHCTDNVTPAERSEPWYLLWGSLYGSLMRPAIPLFVMVTGALLLPVKETSGTFYKKRIPRLIVPFLIWSMLYNLFPWITGVIGLDPSIINDFFAWAEPNQSLSSALENIAMIPFNFSSFAIQMWYVYLLLGLYLYLPIFSAWVGQASKKEKEFFLVLWSVSLFIPYLREYLTGNLWGTCSWNEFGLFYYFAGFNGYLLLGHYIIHHTSESSWTKLVAIGIPMFAIGYCVTFFGFKTVTAVPGQTEEMVELFYTYCSPNVLMMTLPIFMMARKIKLKRGLARSITESISTCTFGIWMSHYLFLGPIYMLFEQIEMHTMTRLVISSILLLTVTWLFVRMIRNLGKTGKWIMG